MKLALLITGILLIKQSYSQSDTIFVEFSGFYDPAQQGYYPTYNGNSSILPKVKLDTLKAKHDTIPFTGILVTNYLWSSIYHPNIFRITIDSIVNGKSISYKYSEPRANNWIRVDGFKNDSISVHCQYDSYNNLWTRGINYITNDANVIYELFEYSSELPLFLVYHCKFVNDKKEGLETHWIIDSIKTYILYQNGRIIDILNEDVIYLNPENGKVISKDEFFQIANSDVYDVDDINIHYEEESVEGTKYQFLICTVSSNNYDFSKEEGFIRAILLKKIKKSQKKN